MNVEEFANAFKNTVADERSQAAQIDAIYTMLRVLMAHELHKLTSATPLTSANSRDAS